MPGCPALAGSGVRRSKLTTIGSCPSLTTYRFANLIWACIDLLVRYVRWNVDKVSRPSFLAEFQLVAPAHSSSALDDVENSLQFSMVMRPSLGIGLNQHRTGPQFACSSSRMGDGGSARHARCLWRIQIKFIPMNDFHSMLCPIHLLASFRVLQEMKCTSSSN